MADIPSVGKEVQPGTFSVTWILGNGDKGIPFSCSPKLYGNSDRSVQVFGTFGVGGTVVFEGTNDDAEAQYNTLRNNADTLLSYSVTDIRQCVEVCLKVRPRVTAGDGSTALTVILFMARNHA